MQNQTQDFSLFLVPCLRGAKEACPGADARWLAAVATLAALDFADSLVPEDEDDEPDLSDTDERARTWGEYYATNVAELPSVL